MKSRITLMLIPLILAFATDRLPAQHYTGAAAKNLNKDASELIVHHLRNNISFIRVDESKMIASTSAVTWLKHDVIGARAEDDLIQYQNHGDNSGFIHDRYKQNYKGVPVEYGVYYVHSKGGRIVSANGEWYDGIQLSIVPSLLPQTAYQKASAYLGAQSFYHDKEDADNNKLMILPHDGSFTLVYRCDVFSANPYRRSFVYVDANDGTVVKETSRIQNLSVHGTAVTQYTGNQIIGTDSISPISYRLREKFRGAGVETYDFSNGSADYYDADNYWQTFNILDVIAYDAHFGAEATYDFYDANFGWKSVDGNGVKKLISYTHNNGAGAINAFWDGTAMNYGDGDPQHGVGALTSLEIVGHELTHGVTENSSGLIYGGESGALNESFSDIAGISIRFQHLPNATWMIADQENFPFRDMSNPKVFNCPDTYNGTFWNFGDIVHFNSGVQNFWFYLLSVGKTGVNDVGDVYNVKGIGVSNAVKIALRGNMEYLTPNSDFQDARDMSIQAAIDLFGDCSNEVIQTANAWYAVNVGQLYANSVNAIFYASQTHYCSAPASVSFTNKSNNGSGYSWSFGDGGTSTQVNPSHNYSDPGTYTVSLTVTGTSSCGTTSTLAYTDYITIANTGSPVAATCTPTTTGSAGTFGIYRFKLNTIDNITSNSDKYKDYSCSQSTTLTAESQYGFEIFTNGNVFYENPAEDVRIWIDYDNNGVFDNVSELAFSKDNDSTIIKGYIKVPSTALMNTPLRLRLMDDRMSSTITGPCFTPAVGQCEDYSVIIVPTSVAPVAEFTALPTSISLGKSVNFTDFSENGPTTWNWNFEGGAPSSSTVENPTGIVYSTVGSYKVTLIASNTFGSDTITKENFITVNPVFNFCQYSEAPYNTGGFFDSGGPFANYGNNENCSLLIAPPSGSPITLEVSTFKTQANSDVMKIYDGQDASATLLSTISGSPSLPITVFSTGGFMFITWVSNSTTANKGYYATWSATNSITTESVNTTLSQGDEVMVNYTVKGVFNTGNVFTAQLSNSNGSFASPVAIGSVASTSSGSITAIIPLNTINGSAYRIRVVSSNPVVIGSDNGQNITIGAATCLVPTGVAINNITANSASLSWDVMSGAIKYQVRYRPAGSTDWTFKNALTNSIQITGLSPNTKYAFGVRTICSTQPLIKSSWTLNKKFKTSQLRLDESIETTNIEVYPNPTSGVANVSFTLDRSTSVMIELYTAEGKLISTLLNSTLTEGNQEITFNSESLDAGIYFLRISIGDQLTWKKIIKAR